MGHGGAGNGGGVYSAPALRGQPWFSAHRTRTPRSLAERTAPSEQVLPFYPGLHTHKGAKMSPAHAGGNTDLLYSITDAVTVPACAPNT